MKFTNKVVVPMERRGCMQSCGSEGTCTAGNGSIGFGASSGLVVGRSGVTGLRRPIAPMRNRSLLTGLPSCLKPADAIRSGSSDITYIPTEEGWLYLAVIMDLYSRRIIGWAFAHHLGTELVAAALAMALVHRRPPEGLIHHSDRGVQYASARLPPGAQGARRGCQHES